MTKDDGATTSMASTFRFAGLVARAAAGFVPRRRDAGARPARERIG